MAGSCGHDMKHLGGVNVGLFLLGQANLVSQEGLVCAVFIDVCDTKGGLETYYQLKFFVIRERKFKLL